MVSGSISLPFLGFFSPFLHSTGSLSVSREYLALPDGAGRFTQDFTGPALLRILTGLLPYVYGTITLFGQVFQTCSTSYTGPYISPTTPRHKSIEVWANPRSLATTCGITIVFFSYGYLDVSVPRVRFPYGMTGLQPAGLPHSEISGSKVICTSPKLIAACHVLHRL